MILLAAFAISVGCFPIDAPKDQITAADVARALPEWNQIAPDAVVALAPAPGVIRVLHVADLRRIGARLGIASEPASDVCFRRPLAVVPSDRMLALMRARLPDARIEIVESSRVPAPQGELEFPLSGLRPGYWFGYITYGVNHKFVVWARVEVKLTVKRVVASADLPTGRPIAAEQVHMQEIQTVPGPNSPDTGTEMIDDLIGRVPHRAIRAGAVIRKDWLDAPKVVRQGEVVKVEVVSGLARLETEGIAEASGAVGEMITVQNPESKRRFRARIESEGRVSVKGSL